ncbi:L,D-transpeptidase family protein [Paracoccus sp. ME4]|uniref:L,D-transpeptidase family protein n=1 Tax=Paracoccus sp. ME4 TaxID=3138066 RepID=UPI00398B79AF
MIGRRTFIQVGAGALGALAMPSLALAAGPGRVGHIQVRKAARKLELISPDRKLIKSYDMRLGFKPVGAKRFQGDGRTPEGIYRIDRKNSQSAFHLSLGVSYPSRKDLSYAASRGRSPGGDIFIHGQPNGFQGVHSHDWTRGCIAVSNDDVEELWGLIPASMQVAIFA